MRPIHANLSATVQSFAAQNQLENINTTLELLSPYIQSVADWQDIHQALDVLPDAIKLEHPAVLPWYISALIGTRAFEQIKQLRASHPPVLVARAWLLLCQNNSTESHSILTKALPHLTGRMLIFAQTHLARASFLLGLEWKTIFDQAKLGASGRSKGFCLLEEAGCYAHSGDSTTARDLWLEALPHFKQDPYHQAWLRYNLGISCAKDLSPDAERHFYELQRLAQKPDLKAWQSRAWSGFGVTHRIRGEWQRAIYAYHRAEQTALEPDDHIEATSSLALTLRLAGRIPEALEVLALSEYPSPALEVQKAACHLSAQNPNRAKTILESIQPQTSADQIRAAYAKAELARLESNLNAALEYLSDLPENHLVNREESMYWQDLNSLRQLAKRPTPAPLEYTKHLYVSVYALGGLRVLVNSRSVQLEPRSAELLLLLLEHGKAASLGALAAQMFPESSPKSAQSNVRRVLVALRDSLS